MTKDILSALADVLTGSHYPKAKSEATKEVEHKWFLCVSDGQGGVQRYEAGSVFQAETMCKEWLATGWPAWIQDEEGRHVHIATKPREKN
jgi:hypothetical protein